MTLFYSFTTLTSKVAPSSRANVSDLSAKLFHLLLQSQCSYFKRMQWSHSNVNLLKRNIPEALQRGAPNMLHERPVDSCAQQRCWQKIVLWNFSSEYPQSFPFQNFGRTQNGGALTALQILIFRSAQNDEITRRGAFPGVCFFVLLIGCILHWLGDTSLHLQEWRSWRTLPDQDEIQQHCY